MIYETVLYILWNKLTDVFASVSNAIPNFQQPSTFKSQLNECFWWDVTSAKQEH